MAQAQPFQVPRHEEGEPSVLSELVRVPVPRSPGRGDVAQNRKGPAPSAHARRPFPQLAAMPLSTRFPTLGNIKDAGGYVPGTWR